MSKKSYKIAHISDLHISDISWNIHHFFSKRWIAIANLLLSRKKQFSFPQLWEFPQLLQNLSIDTLIVSGDISSSSSQKEFSIGHKLFSAIQEKGIQILAIPGNHDNYTKKAHQDKTFYKYFTNTLSNNGPLYDLHLSQDGIETFHLWENWYYVGIDCSIATSLISSRGLFSENLEKNIDTVFEKLPQNSRIIFVNHFPFLDQVSPRKTLLRKEALALSIKKHKNIVFYLHGHTHQHFFTDLRPKGYPVVLDSGSAAHNSIGSFNIIELVDHQCTIDIYQRKDKTWKIREKRRLKL